MPTPADLLITARSIITLADHRAPARAEALAIRQGRIVAVGTARALARLIGPQTEIRHHPDATIVPGLVDSHCHFTGLGWALTQLNATGSQLDAITAQVAAAPGDGWIQGRGWDQTLWPGAAFPTHAPLTAAQPHRPVALRRVDGHATWANAEAMRIAGVDAHTPDPPGGQIVRDAHGAPTGVFIDAAMPLVEAAIPPPTDADVHRWSQRALAACHAAGLTGVHETGSSAQMIRVYRQAQLPLRIHALLDADDPHIGPLLAAGPAPDPWVAVRGYKLYADGALGSRGAWLSAPYTDDPSTSGLAIQHGDALAARVAPAAQAGFQIGVHAIGDAAVHDVLNVYQRLGGPRWRIEHAQIVRPSDRARFAELGVIATVQPTHATSDWRWAHTRLGPERMGWAYPTATLLNAGARVSLGSDFPIEAPTAAFGLHAAVTRQDATGHPAGGFQPHERLTPEQALRGFTIEPAFASFTEAHRGRIAPGFDADLTLLSADPLTCAPEELRHIKVLGVVVGGR